MRPIVAVLLALLLTAPAAFAQPKKGLPKITPKRTINPPRGPEISGGIGSLYQAHLPSIMSSSHHFPYHPSGIWGGTGTYHSPMGLLHGLGMPHYPMGLQHGLGIPQYPMGPNRNPWWFLRDRSPFDPSDPRDLDGNLSLMMPNRLIMRQMFAPQALDLMGLTDDDFLFSFLLGGSRSGSLWDLGIRSFPRGMMSPFGTLPQSRGLSGRVSVMPVAPYYQSGFHPSSGRYSMGLQTASQFFYRPPNFGSRVYPYLPNSGIGLPRGTIPYYPAPKLPRVIVIGEAPQPAPKPLAAKPLTDEERKLLRSFEKDLAGVVAAARDKDQTKLDTAIGKVLSTSDLPESVRLDLKEMDTAAKEIAASRWLANASVLFANLERDHGRRYPKGIAGLGIAASLNAMIAPAAADHVECRAFELKVLTADIERVQKLVARLADDAATKKEDPATAAAVEKLLGRPISGVETLVWLHMRADKRSAEDVAAELRKTR